MQNENNPEEEQKRQLRYLILITAVLCALVIGYNAFYVPDAPLLEPEVLTDVSSAANSAGSISSKEIIVEENLQEEVQASVPSSALASSAFYQGHVKENKEVSSVNQASQQDSFKVKQSGETVNINTATAKELSEKLDGIGDELAHRIVAYREKYGKFQSIDQIKNVSGIGDKRYAKIRNSITVQ